MTFSSNSSPYASVAAEWSDTAGSDQWTVRRLVRQPDEVPMYFERPLRRSGPRRMRSWTLRSIWPLPSPVGVHS